MVKLLPYIIDGDVKVTPIRDVYISIGLPQRGLYYVCNKTGLPLYFFYGFTTLGALSITLLKIIYVEECGENG